MDITVNKWLAGDVGGGDKDLWALAQNSTALQLILLLARGVQGGMGGMVEAPLAGRACCCCSRTHTCLVCAPCATACLGWLIWVANDVYRRPCDGGRDAFCWPQSPAGRSIHVSIHRSQITRTRLSLAHAAWPHKHKTCTLVGVLTYVVRC